MAPPLVRPGLARLSSLANVMQALACWNAEQRHLIMQGPHCRAQAGRRR